MGVDDDCVGADVEVEVEVGLLEALPVFPVLPVLVVELPVVAELVVPLVEDVELDAAPPGCSRATTTPMTAVAPAAATMAERVMKRNRD